MTKVVDQANMILMNLEPTAGSASLLYDICAQLSSIEDDFVYSDLILKIVSECVPEVTTCEKWQVVTWSVGSRFSVMIENSFCGALVRFTFFLGNEQYIESASFETMNMKGRTFIFQDKLTILRTSVVTEVLNTIDV